ncbi:MAG TPA: prepilin-type N-terminal cleavage/methylation domain-containing protein [Rhodocyclaceae bacterium]
MTRLAHHTRQAGFTLMEAIVVIVVTGIVSAMVAVFIKTAIDSYTDTARRAQLADAADVSLRRFARELKLAVPNSVRIKDSNGNVGSCAVPYTCYIEFLTTSGGGRYRDSGDGSTGGNALSFTDSTIKSFDVLGTMPVLNSNAVNGNGDYIVIYNLGTNYAPADAYQLSNCGSSPGCNIAQVQSVAGNTVTLASNSFASQKPPLPSPNSRFFVVPYATRAITYACPTSTSGSFTRYWGYGLNANQIVPPGGSSAVAIGNIVCTVDYLPNALQRNALLYIKLTVSDPAASSETVSVFQQIRIDNTP